MESAGEPGIEMVVIDLRVVLSMRILSLRKTLFYWFLKSLC